MQNFRSDLREVVRERQTAADDIAQILFRFETALDEAIACAGRLATTIPEARVKAKVSAVVGQDAMSRVGNALTALYSARAETVVAHRDFAELYEQMFRKSFASGDLWKIPLVDAPTGSVKLTLVDSHAA
jgi:hypothetical protein